MIGIACGPYIDFPLEQYGAKLERVEAEMLKGPQIDVPLRHTFAPGVYMREVLMKAGAIVIGHEHKTEHLNIVQTGRATVMLNGEVEEIIAPFTFVSKPGVRKVLFIHEDMLWATIHPTEETDLTKLEEALIVKSESFKQHLADIEALTLRLKPLVNEKLNES